MASAASKALYTPAASLSGASVRDFVELLKPGVMSLVVFTGFVGMALAPGNIHPFIGAVAIFCIALGSGASGAINMWYERELDAKMKRTKNRPLPAGRMLPSTAIEYAVMMAFSSVFIMAVAVNFVAAALLLAAILFYVFIYTMWLKPRTPQNIVIGGAAGAFPPMIGWAAVTCDISLSPLVLFAIIFMWTPPHFWALALYRCQDYAKAGIPMLPVVAGEAETKKQILIYTLLLAPLSLAPSLLGFSGIIYLVGAATFSGIFIWHSVRLFVSGGEREAMQAFGYSIVYLFVLFSLLLVDKIFSFAVPYAL
jgi:protoheme IX farnesyltransferase